MRTIQRRLLAAALSLLGICAGMPLCVESAEAQSYRYEDEAGNIYWVDRLEQVPARYRSQIIAQPTPISDPKILKKKAKEAKKALAAKKKKAKKQAKVKRIPKPKKTKQKKEQAQAPERPAYPLPPPGAVQLPPGMGQIPPGGGAEQPAPPVLQGPKE